MSAVLARQQKTVAACYAGLSLLPCLYLLCSKCIKKTADQRPRLIHKVLVMGYQTQTFIVNQYSVT